MQMALSLATSKGGRMVIAPLLAMIPYLIVSAVDKKQVEKLDDNTFAKAMTRQIYFFVAMAIILFFLLGYLPTGTGSVRSMFVNTALQQ